MKLGAILVCCLQSDHQPKLLDQVAGKPLLWYFYSRLESLQQHGWRIVVTAGDLQCDLITEFCQNHQIDLFRDYENSVVDNLLNAAGHFELDWFARLDPFSPFVDSNLLEQSTQICRQKHFDFVTNCAPASFPWGVTLEVIRTEWLDSLKSTQPLLIDPEQVTSRFYNNLHQIRYYNISNDQSLQTERLTIDTPEDRNWFCDFVEQHNDWPNVSYLDAVADLKSRRKAA